MTNQSKTGPLRLNQVEICNECGKSVRLGTGLFVNRVPDFNDLATRIEMGKPFPEGDFICPQCDYRIRSGLEEGTDGFRD